MLVRGRLLKIEVRTKGDLFLDATVLHRDVEDKDFKIINEHLKVLLKDYRF
jgi:hypothetical protein